MPDDPADDCIEIPPEPPVPEPEPKPKPAPPPKPRADPGEPVPVPVRRVKQRYVNRPPRPRRKK